MLGVVITRDYYLGGLKNSMLTMGYLNTIRLLWADAWGLDIFLLRWNFLCNGIGYNGIWSPFISLTYFSSGCFDSPTPFAADSLAVSKEPNMLLICDQKALLINSRSLWFAKHPSITDGLAQSTFPGCLLSNLVSLLLNLPDLFRHTTCVCPTLWVHGYVLECSEFLPLAGIHVMSVWAE